MIDYQDKEKTNISVSLDSANAAVLKIDAFTIAGVRAPAQQMDLTDYQGQAFRLYAEKTGDLSTDKEKDHYWLLAEAEIPQKTTKSVETGEVDENGQARTESEIVPLNLNNVDFKIYALPEVE